MNILHAVITREFAGSESYAAQLASMQARAGHKVLLVVKESTPRTLNRFIHAAAPAKVAYIPKWLPSMFDTFALRGIANGFRPHIIHTHLGRATRRVAPAAQAMKVPHVATLHLEYREEYGGCNGLICVAGWQKKDIPPAFSGQVATVWNWAPPAPPGKPPVRKASQPMTFGSVGRLVERKGMDVLIRAFRSAFPTGDENVRLVIAGEGPQMEELQALAKADGRIELLGYQQDVMGLYLGWDVYVSASHNEAFGLTLLEAMQAGCRLVCTRTQGPQEFLAGFQLGWADPGDVASLAAALKQVAAVKPQRVPWEMEAFSAAVAMEKIEQFYKAVLDKKG